MEWKQSGWMLIPIGGMSMLAVLFVVLWQAMGHQTASINQLQQRTGDLEGQMQENPAISTQLLEQQLKQLQGNQRELEDRISRIARQQTELLQLEQSLKQHWRPEQQWRPEQRWESQPPEVLELQR